ncbi:M23 family metallopeptidase [Halonatronum saccharophilum]|uniref:M23 family metallopeptidase n=1 Tax=Halonatronum saccharophilum TaxID=150060 RepID=UPI000489BDF2|nr:M23 family metallopeptidase [Halonatronum saccharophilum]
MNAVEGDRVNSNTVIGTMGNTGRVYSHHEDGCGTHLDFEIMKDGRYIDPEPFLKGHNIVYTEGDYGSSRSGSCSGRTMSWSRFSGGSCGGSSRSSSSSSRTSNGGCSGSTVTWEEFKERTSNGGGSNSTAPINSGSCSGNTQTWEEFSGEDDKVDDGGGTNNNPGDKLFEEGLERFNESYDRELTTKERVAGYVVLDLLLTGAGSAVTGSPDIGKNASKLITCALPRIVGITDAANDSKIAETIVKTPEYMAAQSQMDTGLIINAVYNIVNEIEGVIEKGMDKLDEYTISDEAYQKLLDQAYENHNIEDYAKSYSENYSDETSTGSC